LVFERFLKLSIGLSPLDRDAEQARETGKEIGVRFVDWKRARRASPHNWASGESM
jgi:hypothetical protein